MNKALFGAYVSCVDVQNAHFQITVRFSANKEENT